jgi:hypothetical protein
VFASALREVNEDDALFEFNHPLKSPPMKLEAKLFGMR